MLKLEGSGRLASSSSGEAPGASRTGIEEVLTGVGGGTLNDLGNVRWDSGVGPRGLPFSSAGLLGGLVLGSSGCLPLSATSDFHLIIPPLGKRHIPAV